MQSLGNEFADHSQLPETIKPGFPIRICINNIQDLESPGGAVVIEGIKRDYLLALSFFACFVVCF